MVRSINDLFLLRISEKLGEKETEEVEYIIPKNFSLLLTVS